MKIKRILALILTVVCVLGCVSFASAADITTEPGETITYTVSLAEQAKIAGYRVYVDFDTSVFTPVMEDGELVVDLGSFTTRGTIMGNTTATGVAVLWFHTSNVTATGSLCTFSLKVNENAPAGTYPVTLRYEADDTLNVEEELVSISLTGDKNIVVKGEEPVPPVDPSEAVQITVSDATVWAGDSVSVPVMISNNSGFAGLTMKVAAPEGFTLTSITKGSMLSGVTGATWMVNNNLVLFYNATNVTGNGELMVLNFKVAEDCKAGAHEIVVTQDEDVFCDEKDNLVPFVIANGNVTLKMLGDVNGDGAVNVADGILISRHSAEMDTLTGDQFKAADLNGDGKVNVRDCVKMAQYLVGMITEF